jgi:hypothetical protein
MRNNKIIIIGSGQIGSRHLQSLRSIEIPLNIFVFDTSKDALKTAKDRYNEMPKSNHEHQLNFINDLPGNDAFDVAIIATCSDVRFSVTKRLIENNKIKYIVFEKILFNEKKQYKRMADLLKKHKIKAWVNCSMQMMPFFKELREEIKNPILYTVTGSKYGLITNAIHYLQHIAYLTNCYEYNLNTDLLDSKLMKNKRKGFLELNGTLVANFKDKSIAILNCIANGDAPIKIEVSNQDFRIIFRQNEDKAWISKSKDKWQWKEINATIPYQSSLTKTLVEDILSKNTCSLPAYKEAVIVHLQMLEPLKHFLNKNKRNKYSRYPLT